MTARPLAVTLIGWLYVATGVLGLAAHLVDLTPPHPFEYDIVLIALVEIIAIVSGIYILRGSNWARWMALAWMAFHVVLSISHTRSELLVHSLLFLVIAYFLFRRQASRYFRAA